jgi:hypothetical protein
VFGTGRIEAQLRETRDIAVRAETKADGHVIACIEHNKRIEDLLSDGQKIREAQHIENQTAIASLKTRMLTMIISALCAVVIALGGALYAIFSHKLGIA